MRLTCTNGELPSRLPFGNEEGDFQLESGGPITRIVALTKPTEALQPPAELGLLWRLVSKLSLNYLVSGLRRGGRISRNSAAAQFRRIAFSREADRRNSQSQSEPHFARLTSPQGVTFARGTRVEIELDEEQFAGTGAYTFAAVMDVFLGLYTSMNSFSQLVVRTRQRKRVLKQWPPRAGQKILMYALEKGALEASLCRALLVRFLPGCACARLAAARKRARWDATAIRKTKWCASAPIPFCISPPARPSIR